MSQPSKSEVWQKLKELGVSLPLHYREYTTEQLQQVLTSLADMHAPRAEEPSQAVAPLRTTPDEVAGLRTNTHIGAPLRTDEHGIIWYQDEVRKAAFPKPRGRRVLKYNDPGVKEVMVSNGEYMETFEMPGDQMRPSEAKITLPSYQVGIYKDPNMPFRIHVYNEIRGFDFFEVQEYYGGADLVPSEIKRVYVENSLCYDIRTTIRAIQAEYRERVLKKEIAE